MPETGRPASSAGRKRAQAEAPLSADEAAVLLHALRTAHLFEANNPEPTPQLLTAILHLERIAFPQIWVRP